MDGARYKMAAEKPINNIHIDYPKDMDSECVELCDYFNSVGLKTKFSCCGHNIADYQIIFDDEVTDEMIERFVVKCSDKYDHTPFLGQFCSWIRKVDGRVIRNWMYMIPYSKKLCSPIEMAKMDLYTMKSIELYNKTETNEVI